MPETVFLLSPANTSGLRAKQLTSPSSKFDAAELKARVCEARGDLSGAIDWLRQALDAGREDIDPDEADDVRNELRLLLRADDVRYVYFVEFRGKAVVLRAAPIDVSQIVRELEHSLSQELDFRQEAENTRIIGRQIAGFSRLATPTVIFLAQAGQTPPAAFASSGLMETPQFRCPSK